MAEDRRIHRTVRVGGRAYTPGQEDELYGVLDPDSVEGLTGKGVIEGDWSGSGEGAAADDEVRKEKDPTLAAGTKDPITLGGSGDGGFPEGFPGAESLADAGLNDPDAVRAYVEAGGDLTEIEGVGSATAKKITKALG